MTDKNRKVTTLKDKFNKIEQKMNPEDNPLEVVKRKARSEIEPLDTSFLKVNSRKIKSHKKVLLNAQKQLEKNKTDLQSLTELKNDNHYKLEKLTIAIQETNRELVNLEDSIKDLQNDRISDESRAGKLQTKKVELEAEIEEAKRQKQIITSDYNNLLNSIYLKESELGRIEEDLASTLVEVERIEKEFARESRNLKSISQDLEKQSFRHQKATVENKSLTEKHKDIVLTIKNNREQIDTLKQEIYKLNGENSRIHSHVQDLEQELVRLEDKHSSNFKDVENLRDHKTAYARQRDELISTLKALKTENSKNILELEVRNKEKISLEKEVNKLLSEKTRFENKVFSQKATLQSLESSINEYNREKTQLSDSIKLHKLHSERYETDVIKLRKEASNLKEQYNLLLSECDRYKKEANASKHKFIDAQNSRNNWADKKDMAITAISDYKSTITQNNNKIDSYIQEIESIKSQIRVKQGDIDRYKAIHDNTAKQVDKARAQHDEVATTYRRILKERTSWSQRVHSREEYIQNVAEKVNKVKDEIYSTEQEIEQDKMYLAQTESKIETTKSEQDFLAETLDQRKNQKLKLTQQINNLKKRLDDVELVKNRLEKENEELGKSFEALQARVPQLDDQYEMLVSAIDGAKVEHQNLYSACDDLKAQIKVKEGSVRKLEAEFEKIHVVTVNLQKENQREKIDIEKRYEKLSREKREIESKIHNRKKAMLRMTTGQTELQKQHDLLQQEIEGIRATGLKLDSEMQAIKTAMDQRALEIQTMKTSIKEGTSANINKQEQIAKLMARSNKLEKQAASISADNGVSKGVVTQLGSEIRELHDKNAYMADKLQSEMKAKNDVKRKINQMKQEIDRLKDTYLTEQTRSTRVKSQRDALEQEYVKLQETKELLLDEIEMKMSSVSAEGSKTKTISSNIKDVEKDILSLKQSDVLKQDKANVYSKVSDLAAAINLRVTESKNATVMFSAVNELIEIISENEFEGLKWIARLSSSRNLDGCKIRFKNMKTQYSEMKKILKPITQKFAEKYKAYGFQIETRSKTSPGEVIEAMEFKITIKKPVTKSSIANAR